MYTVYKTVCLVNQKFYIGVHKTNNPNDEYLGSGKVLKRAIKKYGVSSFEKEVLLITEDVEEAYRLEASLITEELVSSDYCYNLKMGGQGGFDFINLNGRNAFKLGKGKPPTRDAQAKGGRQTDERAKNDPIFASFLSSIRKKNIEAFIGHFTGQVHTKESKKRIGTANSIAQGGEKNSQYGTCWITHPNFGNKKVRKDELDIWIDAGWKLGRVN